jgi:hypothetical protein
LGFAAQHSAYQTRPDQNRRFGQKDSAKKLIEGRSFRAERNAHLTNIFDNAICFQSGSADRDGYLQSTLEVMAVTTLEVVAVTTPEELVKHGIIYPDLDNPSAPFLSVARKNGVDEG